jgi:putative peptidoglycan lipid II flippase
VSAEKPSRPVKTSKGGLIRSSMVFSSLTLVSRFMGLARDLFITARLGASATPAADAFNTAQSFPNLFRRIFAEGAFTAARRARRRLTVWRPTPSPPWRPRRSR